MSNITYGEEGKGCDVNVLVNMGARTFRVYINSALAALANVEDDDGNNLLREVVKMVTVDGAFSTSLS